MGTHSVLNKMSKTIIESKAHVESKSSKLPELLVKLTPIKMPGEGGVIICEFNPDEVREDGRKILPTISKELKKEVFDRLMQSEVVEIILNDDLILKLAKERFDGIRNQTNKFDSNYHSKLDVLKQELRRAGRLLDAFRQVTKKTNLSLINIYDEQCLSAVPEVARILSQNYNKPHVLDKMKCLLGHIKNIASFYLPDEDLLKLQAKYKRIMGKWRYSINRHTNTAKLQMNLQKKFKQPSEKERSRLNDFINYKLKRYLKKNVKNCTYSDYLMLIRLTLTRITLFNFRRSGEIARLTIQQYENRLKNSDLTAHQSHLTELAKSIEVITLKGKSQKNEIVYAISLGLWKKALEKILEVRQKFTLLKNNKFVFGVSGPDNLHINGYKAIKYIVEKSGVKNIKAFTAGNFRKMISTDMVRMTNLGSDGKKLLMSHLGHTPSIHENVYDQNINSDRTRFVTLPELLVSYELNRECTSGRKFTEKGTLAEARKQGLLTYESDDSAQSIIISSKEKTAPASPGSSKQSDDRSISDCDGKRYIKTDDTEVFENDDRERRTPTSTKRRHPSRLCKKQDNYFSTESDESNYSSSTEYEPYSEEDDEFIENGVKSRKRRKRSNQKMVRWTETMNEILKKEFEEELKNNQLPIKKHKLDKCRMRFSQDVLCKEVSNSSIKCTLHNIRKGLRKI